MLFQKHSYPVINPPVDCFEILQNGKIYTLNCKKKNFLKKLEEYVKKGILDWQDVSRQTFFTRAMTEEFMRKHIDDLEWCSVLHSADLSESFMREIIDYLDWFWIMHNKQFFSKDILREFINKAQYDIAAGEKISWEDLFDKLIWYPDE